jgi:hypothetical protein
VSKNLIQKDFFILSEHYADGMIYIKKSLYSEGITPSDSVLVIDRNVSSIKRGKIEAVKNKYYCKDIW